MMNNTLRNRRALMSFTVFKIRGIFSHRCSSMRKQRETFCKLMFLDQSWERNLRGELREKKINSHPLHFLTKDERDRELDRCVDLKKSKMRWSIFSSRSVSFTRCNFHSEEQPVISVRRDWEKLKTLKSIQTILKRTWETAYWTQCV